MVQLLESVNFLKSIHCFSNKRMFTIIKITMTRFITRFQFLRASIFICTFCKLKIITRLYLYKSFNWIKSWEITLWNERIMGFRVWLVFEWELYHLVTMWPQSSYLCSLRKIIIPVLIGKWEFYEILYKMPSTVFGPYYMFNPFFTFSRRKY